MDPRRNVRIRGRAGLSVVSPKTAMDKQGAAIRLQPSALNTFFKANQTANYSSQIVFLPRNL